MEKTTLSALVSNRNRFSVKFFMLLLLFVGVSVSEGWGQLFQQDFSSSSTISTYVNSTNPSNGQFTQIAASSGSSVSISSNKLSLTRSSGGSSNFVRSIGFSPSPTALILKFDISVTGNSTANNTQGTFYLGTSGFLNDNATISNANSYSRLGIGWTGTAGQWFIRDLVNSSSGNNYTGTNTIVWVLNNSGSTLTYRTPNNSEESIANDKMDIWIGTTKEFNDINVQTSTITAIDKMKFISSGQTGSILFDNILIDPIPTVPISNTASNTSPTGFQANWSTVTGVTGYRLDVSTTSDFSTYVSGYNNKYISGQSTISHNITDLNPNTTYYYRVRGASQYTVGEFASGNSTTQNTTTTSGTSPNLALGTLTTFGDQCINSTYGPNSFTITGTNLTDDDVTVGALSGYTYSTATDGLYTSTLSIPQGGGSFSQTIYVKFSPTAVQSYNGNISVSGGGGKFGKLRSKWSRSKHCSNSYNSNQHFYYYHHRNSWWKFNHHWL